VAASGSPPSVASARTGRRVTPEEVSSKALIFLFCLCPPSLTLIPVATTVEHTAVLLIHILVYTQYWITGTVVRSWLCGVFISTSVVFIHSIYPHPHTHHRDCSRYTTHCIIRVDHTSRDTSDWLRHRQYTVHEALYGSRREAQARGQTVSKHDARQAYGKPPAPRAATHEMNTAAASRWNQVLASTTPGMTAKARPLGCRANGDE
jgi:hypothetical protein